MRLEDLMSIKGQIVYILVEVKYSMSVAAAEERFSARSTLHNL